MGRSMEQDVPGYSKKRKARCNQKKKGNANELAATKALQKWTGVKFTRTPQSGALRRINSDGIVADIIPDTLDKNFYWPFSVETKHLMHIPVAKQLPKNSMIFSIWEQVHRDALRAEQLPMALLRSNGMPSGEYYLILRRDSGGRLLSLAAPVAFYGFNGTYDLMGFMFSDVVKTTDYTLFSKAIKAAKLLPNVTLFITE